MSNSAFSNTPDNEHQPETPSPSSSAPTKYKLRKIPPIPIRKTAIRLDNDQDHDKVDDQTSDMPNEKPTVPVVNGLNHIRTQSAPAPSSLKPSNLGNSSSSGIDECKNEKATVMDKKLKWAIPFRGVPSPDKGIDCTISITYLKKSL